MLLKCFTGYYDRIPLLSRTQLGWLQFTCALFDVRCTSRCLNEWIFRRSIVINLTVLFIYKWVIPFLMILSCIAASIVVALIKVLKSIIGPLMVKCELSIIIVLFIISTTFLWVFMIRWKKWCSWMLYDDWEKRN